MQYFLSRIGSDICLYRVSDQAQLEQFSCLLYPYVTYNLLSILYLHVRTHTKSHILWQAEEAVIRRAELEQSPSGGKHHKSRAEKKRRSEKIQIFDLASQALSEL